jgi:hypothetical protein
VTTTGAQLWSLDSDGLLGAPTPGGWFSITLGATDTDGDGVAELLVGSPGEDIGTKLGAGAISRFGTQAGVPSATGSRHWSQNTSGVAGAAAQTDFFGSAFTFPRG